MSFSAFMGDEKSIGNVWIWFYIDINNFCKNTNLYKQWDFSTTEPRSSGVKLDLAGSSSSLETYNASNKKAFLICGQGRFSKRMNNFCIRENDSLPERHCSPKRCSVLRAVISAPDLLWVGMKWSLIFLLHGPFQASFRTSFRKVPVPQIVRETKCRPKQFATHLLWASS